MTGPYETLHVYEVEGRGGDVPSHWASADLLGIWHEGDYRFFFFSSPRRQLVQEWVQAVPGLRMGSETILPYEDWEAGGRLRPFRVADLWVSPPWESVAAGPGESTVWVDPGVSFGSGNHPSTRCCLELMAGVWHRARPRRVLDLGTGTGILALAAARWGAERVLAVDLQPLAVDTARANVLRNGLEGRVTVVQRDALDALSEEADLVLANLSLEVLCALVERPQAQDKPWLIVSGLAGRQEARLESRLGPLPFRIEQRRHGGHWSSLLLSTPARDVRLPRGGPE
jgi:ribosomal protein L11 methyltransferase